MSSQSELEELWRSLESPGLKEYESLGTEVYTSGGEVRIALDGNGMRRLLIPIGNAREEREDHKSRGVHLTPHSLKEGDRLRLYLDVQCRLPHLAELFCKIGCEILNNLRKDPRDPGMTVVKILNRWRELLGKEESRILGDEQLAGLIGELLLLSTLATNSHDAIYCWVGPEGQTKDFSGREWDIEVKARLSVNRKFVKINGIEQLERRKDTSLLLAVYTLLKKKQGAINLPQLVEDLIDKGLDEVELLSRLREVGYQLGDREHYLSRCFELAGLSAYLVEEEFPRLVGTKLKEPLAAEISSVSYLLDLSKQESMTPEQFGDFVSTLEVP